MHEHQIVRRMLRRIGRNLPATAPLAKAVHDMGARRMSTGSAGSSAASEDIGWEALLAATLRWQPLGECARRCSRSPTSCVAARLRSARPCAARADDRGRTGAARLWAGRGDVPGRISTCSGCSAHWPGPSPVDAGRLARRSAAVRLGLASFGHDYQGRDQINLSWSLERVLDAAPRPGRLAARGAGRHLARSRAARARRFRGGGGRTISSGCSAARSRERAVGINLLIHGPPGTGKTEYRRGRWRRLRARGLHAVAEADEDGAEPKRW